MLGSCPSICLLRNVGAIYMLQRFLPASPFCLHSSMKTQSIPQGASAVPPTTVSTARGTQRQPHPAPEVRTASRGDGSGQQAVGAPSKQEDARGGCDPPTPLAHGHHTLQCTRKGGCYQQRCHIPASKCPLGLTGFTRLHE